MSRTADFPRIHLAGAFRARSAGRLISTLLVPAALSLVLLCGLAPALGGSERIPVAVVNLDEGASGPNGGTVYEGEDLVDELTDTETLAWDVVDEQTADAGLEDGSYALVLRIPADYSSKVMSLTGSDPQKANVELISSGSENILATRVGSAVLRQCQARLRASLGEDYVVSVLSDVQGQASKLTLTSDGAVMLDAGYDALAQGSEAIAEGLGQSASGVEQLGSGIAQIADGVEATGVGTAALGSGLAQVQQQAIAPLEYGAEALGSGLDAVSGQLTSMGDGVSAMGSRLTSLSEQLSLDDDDLAALGSLATEMAEPARSLQSALATMGDSSDDALSAAREIGATVEGSTASLEQVRSDASDLALELSNPDDGASGIAQDATGIADAAAVWSDADMQRQLAEAYAAGQAATDEQRQLIASFSDDMAELAGDADALSERATNAAASARDVSDSAGEASSLLEASSEAQSKLAQAVDSYEGASSAATSAAEELAALASEAIEPAGDAVLGVVATKAALEQMGPALVATGQGVSAISSQLSDTGAIGQGVSGIATGIGALNAAMSPLASGADQLGVANTTLAAALDGIASGTSGLGYGLDAMAQATGQIAEGSLQLKEASSQINDATSEAADVLSDLARDREDRAEVVASPLSIVSESSSDTTADVAVAAAFAAVALWVGACLTGCLVPACDMRAIAAGSGVRSTAGKLAIYMAIGAMQAAVTGLALAVAGTPIAAAPSWLALLLVTGAVFGAVACALRLVCGRWFVWVFACLLVVQLLCAGSVLPVPLTGGVFRALGEVLPVPVVSQALRSLAAGAGRGVAAAWTLLAALAVAAVGAAVALTLARRTVRPERVFSASDS